MRVSDLVRILEGDVEYIDWVNKKDIAKFEDNIKVYPKHVKKMLETYLVGKLTADDLNKWARFICIRSEYCIPNTIDDQMVAFYEDMWYVIQKLSTPEIDGEINQIRVKSYLGELAKYKN